MMSCLRQGAKQKKGHRSTGGIGIRYRRHRGHRRRQNGSGVRRDIQFLLAGVPEYVSGAHGLTLHGGDRSVGVLRLWWHFSGRENIKCGTEAH